MRERGGNVRNTVADLIRSAVIKNLLLAHKRIAWAGNAKEIICLSKYLLKLSKEFHDIVVEVSSEQVEKF